jgi:hypothetical protein
VRVCKLCCNNELEVIIVGHELVIKFDRPLALHLHNWLNQDGFERGVELLFDVLE